jgi:hypothetical protein
MGKQSEHDTLGLASSSSKVTTASQRPPLQRPLSQDLRIKFDV